MISITLPSIYPDALKRTLENLRDTSVGEYEVIIVSPFDPPRIVGKNGWIKWVMETEPKGCNPAHAKAFPHARGEYITAWVDDHLYVPRWDEIIIKDFRERVNVQVWNMSAAKPLLMGMRQGPFVGLTFGMYYAYFPFMRTTDAKTTGWFSTDYERDFADVDLAMRVWDYGGVCEWSKEILIAAHVDDNRKGGRQVNESDMNKFISRWKLVYGKDCSTATLRDFNNDIPMPLDIRSIRQ